MAKNSTTGELLSDKPRNCVLKSICCQRTTEGYVITGTLVDDAGVSQFSVPMPEYILTDLISSGLITLAVAKSSLGRPTGS